MLTCLISLGLNCVKSLYILKLSARDMGIFLCSYPMRVNQPYNYNDVLVYMEPILMHKSLLLCLKRTPQFSIHINACPCDGIRDSAEDFPGFQCGEERWELNVRSNGGYKGEIV